jgi:hypothetical protein
MIDEYDNFANSILNKDISFFREITSDGGVLKNFYAALKADTTKNISKIFITGVSSVSLDSVTSGFNIQDYITTNLEFNEYAGFTEEELKELIPKLVDTQALGVTTEELIAEMKPVYDGYCFSRRANSTLFNSSMCLNYLKILRQEQEYYSPENCLDPANDMDSNKLERLFELADEDIVDKIVENFLNDETFVTEQIAQKINLNKEEKLSENKLLSMLFYLGYLTIDSAKTDNKETVLKIPNLYMKRLFAECIANVRLRYNKFFND